MAFVSIQKFYFGILCFVWLALLLFDPSLLSKVKKKKKKILR